MFLRFVYWLRSMSVCLSVCLCPYYTRTHHVMIADDAIKTKEKKGTMSRLVCVSEKSHWSDLPPSGRQCLILFHRSFMAVSPLPYNIWTRNFPSVFSFQSLTWSSTRYSEVFFVFFMLFKSVMETPFSPLCVLRRWKTRLFLRWVGIYFRWRDFICRDGILCLHRQ